MTLEGSGREAERVAETSWVVSASVNFTNEFASKNLQDIIHVYKLHYVIL